MSQDEVSLKATQWHSYCGDGEQTRSRCFSQESRVATADFPERCCRCFSAVHHPAQLWGSPCGRSVLMTPYNNILGGRINGIFKARSVNMMKVIKSIGIMGLWVFSFSIHCSHRFYCKCSPCKKSQVTWRIRKENIEKSKTKTFSGVKWEWYARVVSINEKFLPNISMLNT